MPMTYSLSKEILVTPWLTEWFIVYRVLKVDSWPTVSFLLEIHFSCRALSLLLMCQLYYWLQSQTGVLLDQGLKVVDLESVYNIYRYIRFFFKTNNSTGLPEENIPSKSWHVLLSHLESPFYWDSSNSQQLIRTHVTFMLQLGKICHWSTRD